VDLPSQHNTAIPPHFDFYNGSASFVPIQQPLEEIPNPTDNMFGQAIADRSSKPSAKRSSSVLNKFRCRRTLSSGSDTHMGENPSQTPMPTIPDHIPSSSTVEVNSSELFSYQQ